MVMAVPSTSKSMSCHVPSETRLTTVIFLSGCLLFRARILLTFIDDMRCMSSSSTATILSSSWISPLSGDVSLISQTNGGPPSKGVSTMTPSLPGGAMTCIVTSCPPSSSSSSESSASGSNLESVLPCAPSWFCRCPTRAASLTLPIVPSSRSTYVTVSGGTDPALVPSRRRRFFLLHRHTITIIAATMMPPAQTATMMAICKFDIPFFSGGGLLAPPMILSSIGVPGGGGSTITEPMEVTKL
mmetsp:Transcript_58593/g.124342  ORF Transcript_58593/g.124342 Transcript_58593/m.124342 type:complete len:243 (+) Transcript_58593:575-1303(+)